MLLSSKHWIVYLFSVFIFLFISSCSEEATDAIDITEVLDDGVIFTYPIDGQTDIPLTTHFYTTFTSNVNSIEVSEVCSVDPSGNLDSGKFCLIDEDDNVITITTTITNNIIKFRSDELVQGTQYSLYVNPSVWGAPSAVLSETPLYSFTTRQYDPIVGVSPEVKAINGENPDAFLPGSLISSRLPFMDFFTVRVELSEPVDENSVQLGSSFIFEEVGGTDVEGAIIVKGQHIVFDPDEDLSPGTLYRLTLTTGITDLNGEAITNIIFEVTPTAADSCPDTPNCVIKQTFATTTAFGESGFPKTSLLTNELINVIGATSDLVGNYDMNLRPNALDVELADPSVFPTFLPFVIRKGNILDITGIDISLGGEVPIDLQTGGILATFISDATGFMYRNPYRDASVLIDNDKSPLFVYLNFDLALSSTDINGNSVLNQTIPNVQATGIAIIKDGTITIETVRSVELNLMDLEFASANLILEIQADVEQLNVPDVDNDAPQLLNSYPEDLVANGVDFPVTDNIVLSFSEPIDNSGVVAQDQISLVDITNSSAPVPFELGWNGSSILIKPLSVLEFGHEYEINLYNGDSLKDISGNDLTPASVSDPTGGDGLIRFTTEDPASTTRPPKIISIFPGPPCATTGSTYASPESCIGGEGSDDDYLSVQLEEDKDLEVIFSHAMNLNSLSLGTSCGSGAIRIERLDGFEACAEVVSGSLIKNTRSFRFIPSEPWQVGERYSITLVGGANTSCDADEICSVDNVPLNTDPLNGDGVGGAGGPNIVNKFEAVASDGSTFLSLSMENMTDINGNGFFDAGEVARDSNRAGVDEDNISVSGILTNATIDGESNLYLSGTLPVVLGEAENLSIDETIWGINTVPGGQQIPVEINPGVFYGTSIRIDTSATVLGVGFIPIPIVINDIDTGVNIFRLRQESAQPVRGYIVEDGDNPGKSLFVSQFHLYMDSPDMVITYPLATITHDLQSKPFILNFLGELTFLEDGRIEIDAQNVNVVSINVNIAASIFISGTQNGSMTMNIPAGDMKMRLLSNPIKGRD